MGLKSMIRTFLYRERADSATYIKYLRNRGMCIGERVNIYDPRSVCIDETRSYLIKIGDDVKITRGVTILTHGYDWSVLAGMYDVVLGSSGAVSIGNNVFIGMNTTILKGVHIGNNVIIGAGSLVNKNIPNNCVAVGNPCHVTMKIEDYYVKRIKAQRNEAFEMYKMYLEHYGTEPPQEIFDEFFWLFHKREEPLPECFIRQMKWHDKLNETLINYNNSKPEFEGYEEFLKTAREWMKSTYST